MTRPLTEIRNAVRATWPAIVKRARVRSEALGALPKVPKLLGSGTKTVKGEGLGYLTAVVYMSPAREAFATPDNRTLCPFATAACEAACLGHNAGRMIMAPIKLARLWKTALYLGNRRLWRELISAEIEAFERKARREGYTPVVRVDGSTDTGEGYHLAPLHPGVTFYDYTKVPSRVARAAAPDAPSNYSVTFSYSGANKGDAIEALRKGIGVAVVFSTPKGETLPESWEGFPTLDADETDLRFTDSPGHVAALRFKASRNRESMLAKGIGEGFVIDAAA